MLIRALLAPWTRKKSLVHKTPSVRRTTLTGVLGGIVLGIWDGELGVGGGEVGVETSGEGLGFVGFRGEPVGFFLRVGGDVIEFLVMVLVEADEPPAVFEDGAVWGGSAWVVVRVVPAERAGG